MAEFKTNSPLEFYLFKFHDFFDGLIGLNIMKTLKIKLDIPNFQLETPHVRMSMFTTPKFITPIFKIQGRSKKLIEIPVDIADGEFYIKPITVQEQLIIPEGIYKSLNHISTMEIINFSNLEQTFLFEKPLETLSLNEYQLNTNYLNNVESEDVTHTDIMKLIRSDHLNLEEKLALTKICEKYSNIFQQEHNPLSFTNQIKHDIMLDNSKPIHTKSYRYPYVHKEEVRNQISKMLEQGIIRPSFSPWSSPIWIVPKKQDASQKVKWRLVIDYRKLNEVTIGDRYPIPNITDILDKLGKCQYFTTLDLASGFHQIEVNPRDIEKTAFTVDFGHYEFIRMPFGLKNAPSTFQRVMDNVLGELQGNSCLCYMDDIIVYSTSLQEHITNLEHVFKRLAKANLKVQLDKSEFLKRDVAFLGHIVTPNGVKPNPEKIVAIQNFPIPKTEKQIKSFLGLLGYYRKFINNFSEITKPLTACLRKDCKIILTDQYIQCFEKCKKLLCEEPILQYPDFERPFLVTTDASNVAIGGILSQGPIGSDLPICYASRTLTKTEENYSTIEKEMLAIVWTVKYFRPYLFGQKFTIITDHRPLTWLFSLKEPNSRLIRWRLKLEEYDYDIAYKKGVKNTNADALSRAIPEEQMNLNSISSSSSDSSKPLVYLRDTLSKPIPTTNTILNEFKRQIVLEIDPNKNIQYDVDSKILFESKKRYIFKKSMYDEKTLTEIIKDYVQPNINTGFISNEQTFKTLSKLMTTTFKTENIKLIRCKHLAIDIQDVDMQHRLILEEHNDSNHRGIAENTERLKRKYYFPKLKVQINSLINRCEICQTLKYNRNEKPIKLQMSENPTRPIEVVHMDIFFIEKEQFLTILDKFSRFGVAQILNGNDITSHKVFNIFRQYIMAHGQPEKVIVDNGREFKNDNFKELCALHKIKLHFTSARSSTGNSPVERFHSTILEIYRVLKAKNPKDSVETLMTNAVITYNNSIHSVTHMTPLELKNGHYFRGNTIPEPKPSKFKEIVEKQRKDYDQILQLILNRNTETKRKLIEKANKSRVKPPSLRTGNTVYWKTNRRNKVAPRFNKLEVLKNNKVTIHTKQGKIHKTKIKRPLQVNTGLGTTNQDK